MVRKVRNKGIVKWLKKKKEYKYKPGDICTSLLILFIILIFFIIWICVSYNLFYKDDVLMFNFVPDADRGSWVSSLAIFITLPITIIGIILTIRKK